MERLEYACMGRENVCIRKGWSVRARGEGECVYMKGVECVHGGRMKELSMSAWGEDVCIWKGLSVRAQGKVYVYERCGV